MVQEGCPYIASALRTEPPDVWSARNMRLSPDGGATPAARREGNREAQHAAYRSGMVFRGKIEIPLIDWRHYLEPFLDMHNSHQSFAARQRLLNFDGDASNQVIWFTAATPTGPLVRPDAAWRSSSSTSGWRTSSPTLERAWPGTSPPPRSTAASRPTGRRSRRGDGVWSGVLDNGPKGACTQTFPPFSTSRIVAGGPIEGGIFKCHLRPVATAIADGVYGSWQPTPRERGPARADLPDRGLRLLQGRRGPAARARREARPRSVSVAGRAVADRPPAPALLHYLQFCCAFVNGLTSAAARRISRHDSRAAGCLQPVVRPQCGAAVRTAGGREAGREPSQPCQAAREVHPIHVPAPAAPPVRSQ